jgi:hypothetical protein
MVVLFRLMMMFAGYSAACIAASLVLALGTLGPDWNGLFADLGFHSAHAQSAAMWVVVGLGAIVIFVIGFLPAALVIALTEGFALRSPIVYGVAGALLAFAMVYGLDFSGYLTAAGGDAVHDREVFAAAGIAGGLIYWMFAGRRAGAYK